VNAVPAEEVGRAPVVPLSAVADLVRGVSYPKADAREAPAPGFVPVLRATNIQDARLVLDSDLVYVAERNVASDQLLRAGDIVVATSSGSKHLVGKSGQLHAPWQGSFGAFCATVRPRPGVHPRYLALFLQAPAYWRQITKKALGVNINNLRRGDLESLGVPLPPLAVQASIVAEIEKQFSRLDEAVANLKRVAVGLARYRASTLTESFAVRPGWAVSSYGEVGVVTTGFTPPTSDEANFGGAVPFFKPTDLGAGDNVVTAREYLSDRGLSKGRLLPANSVLVTCIGATIGKTGLARVACATNQQINAVTPDPAVVDPGFLYWWTVSPRGQEQIVSNASATTLPILNKSKFSALAVPLPPLAEQRRIIAEVNRHLSIVCEVEAAVDANLERAQALRQAVLARAFTGSGAAIDLSPNCRGATSCAEPAA